MGSRSFSRLRGVSPASNGGRGLKHCKLLACGGARWVSPASNGGRGLKRPWFRQHRLPRRGIARQQWRARIETTLGSVCEPDTIGIARQQWRARIETCEGPKPETPARVSPASNGGRGLKPVGDLRRPGHDGGIARQQWRARIETSVCAVSVLLRIGIARQQWRARIETCDPCGVAAD